MLLSLDTTFIRKRSDLAIGVGHYMSYEEKWPSYYGLILHLSGREVLLLHVLGWGVSLLLWSDIYEPANIA